jgi:hypothetical protein
MSKSQYIEIAVKILGETEKAYKVDFGGKEPVWVPKSQINDECEENGKITSIFVAEWIALAKGMI